MEFLESENQRLKDELRAALAEIQGLRDENLQLKSQLKDSSKLQRASTIPAVETTFITKGAESPTVQCENW